MVQTQAFQPVPVSAAAGGAMPTAGTDVKDGSIVDVKDTKPDKNSNAPPNVEEMQYLDTVREVMARGIQKTDRTGTGTCVLSFRGDALLSFSLSLLTWVPCGHTSSWMY